ncbi:Gvag protein, partial [Operophtera brumata]
MMLVVMRYPYAGQTVGEVRWRRIGEPDDSGAKRSIRRVLDAWWGERRRVTGAVWGHFSQHCVWGLPGRFGVVQHESTHPHLLLMCDFYCRTEHTDFCCSCDWKSTVWGHFSFYINYIYITGLAFPSASRVRVLSLAFRVCSCVHGAVSGHFSQLYVRVQSMWCTTGPRMVCLSFVTSVTDDICCSGHCRGAVWGHFSQLCMWELQAMGCGAVHHGATQPRVLLVCDFSHTNMLGQRTLNPGPLAPCPIHTARRARTQYPLLCAPVRPVVTSVEPEEDGYDEEEGDYDPGLTLDIGDAPTPSIHYTRSIPMSREPSRSMTHRPRSSVLMFRGNNTQQSHTHSSGLIINV